VCEVKNDGKIVCGPGMFVWKILKKVNTKKKEFKLQAGMIDERLWI
jgi:hypothetical protein